MGGRWGLEGANKTAGVVWRRETAGVALAEEAVAVGRDKIVKKIAYWGRQENQRIEQRIKAHEATGDFEDGGGFGVGGVVFEKDDGGEGGGIEVVRGEEAAGGLRLERGKAETAARVAGDDEADGTVT